MKELNNRVNYPTIPTNVVVHLGAPDEATRNISVPFTTYIKNVASNEIYPTWPDAAIEANILAIISFTLNRIYNEWYPSRGYSFDITSSPKYDQTFIEDKEYFDVISKKVDEIFNNYIYRQGQVQPLYALYCDGRVTTCDGLSQWGSVSLARQGKSALDILRYYYGNDIQIFRDAPVGEVSMTYPGYVLELGEPGDQVQIIQSELNRISDNYPAIPKITRVNGIYGIETENAVKKFNKKREELEKHKNDLIQERIKQNKLQKEMNIKIKKEKEFNKLEENDNIIEKNSEDLILKIQQSERIREEQTKIIERLLSEYNFMINKLRRNPNIEIVNRYDELKLEAENLKNEGMAITKKKKKNKKIIKSKSP